MSHTPGPWKVSRDTAFCEDGPCQVALKGADGMWVATGKLHGHTPQEANLCLIAAAPDLLAQLQRCVDVMLNEENHAIDLMAIWRDSTAAIAKATGGQQ